MAEQIAFRDEHLIRILHLLNQNMEFDSLTETILREKVVDDLDFDPELNLCLWENDRPVAFVSAVIREINAQRTGYIKLMAVAKERRRTGLGRKLYQEIEKRFKNKNVNNVRIYDVPFNYFMPGIDQRYTEALAFFEAMGFQFAGKTSNMVVDLGRQDFSTEAAEAALKDKGLQIARAGYEDMQDIFAFIDNHFPLWRTEVANAYNSLPVSLHIARKNGVVAAFSAHNGNNFGMGWLGPVGVLPQMRGNGIGGILVKRCLQDIKDWELETAVIPRANPARFFSQCAGAQVQRIFLWYEKKPI